MNKKLLGLIAVIVVAILMVGGVLFLSANQKAETDKILKTGVSVAATPDRVDKDTRTKKSGSSKKRVTEYNALFNYTVDGKTYSVESRDFRTQSQADAYLKEPKTVKYLKEDPNKSRLID
jgi:hypothetical protein